MTTPDSAGPVLVATVSAQRADSARIVATSRSGGLHVTTDYVPVVNDTARLILAGLHPSAAYDWHVEAIGPGGKKSGKRQTITADSVPQAIRGVHILTTAGTTPTMPYIMTELVVDSTKYEAIFDSTGTLVWYRTMQRPSGQADFEMQPTGVFTAYDGTSTGWQPVAGTWLAFGLDGAVQKSWTAPSGSFTDQHEFRMRVEDGDTAAYFSIYDIAPLDMTAHCGNATTPTAEHKLVRADAGGLRTIFDARSRFTPADWVSPPVCGLGDFDHPNAFDFDGDHTLVVSWRNLGALTAIDETTGQVLWQLGGQQSTLTLSGDPLNGTGGQHSVRMSGPNTFVVYDNGTNHVPPQSRMAEYTIDAANGVASLTRQYLHPSTIFTMFQGSVSPLADGGVLIGWSTAATITEVDANSHLVWEGVLQLGGVSQQFYRALPLGSLYHYRQP
ncbi:MAG: arylsulfotransferase family protein [Gemmatimonadaceae bacterium]